MNLQPLKAIIAAAAVASFASVSQANHIDFIDEGAFNISDSMGGGATTTTIMGIPTASTLGGQRFLSLNAVTGTVNASLTPSGAGMNDDFAVFSAAVGSQGTFSITIGQAGDLGANFRDMPAPATNDWDRIRLTLATGSSASPSITVTLFSDLQGTATVTQSFLGGAGDVDFLQTAFMMNNPAFTEDTFRDIDRATFEIVGVDGGTYNIASFDRNGSVIPEPGSMSLLGIGALGLASLYLRRRRSAKV